MSRGPLSLASVLFASLAALVDAAPGADRTALVEQVRAAEIAFAKSVLDGKPEVFASFLDPETVFVSGATVTRGKAAVLDSWKGFFEPQRPYFEWHPEVVELTADGTLGLSRGPWVLRAKDKEGKEVERKGVFNSVWRLQPDGSWKVIFDAGCSPCPTCG
jgi:ketosteroid isomerase-like protein